MSLLRHIYRVFGCISFIALAWVGNVAAHNEKVGFAAPVVDIVVDGDFSDWPDGVLWNEISYPYYLSSLQDREDLQGQFVVGYNVDENALYLAVEVRDQSMVLEAEHLDWNTVDGCEVYVDVVHEEGETQLGQYHIWSSTPGVFNGFGDIYGAARQGDFRAAAQRRGGMHFYEWRIDIGAKMQGQVHLQPGATIGVDVALQDKDEDGTYTYMDWGFVDGGGFTSTGTGDVVLLEEVGGTGELRGRLVREDGTAAAYQRLKIQFIAESHFLMETHANAEGMYHLTLPQGLYRIAVGSEGAVATEVEIKADSLSRTEELVVSAPRGRIVEAGPGRNTRAKGRRVRAGPGRWQGAWRTLGVADGLTDPTIADIFQDREGYLWFATSGGGVLRYDGEELIIYTTADGLGDNAVSAIWQDADGTMWFGMGGTVTQGGGVSRFDGEYFVTYKTEDGLPSNFVMNIVQDVDDNLWFSTREGLTRFDGREFAIFTRRDGLYRNEITALEPGRNGGLWIGTRRGLSYFDGLYFVPGPTLGFIEEIVEDRSGHLWVGKRGGGVECWDIRNTAPTDAHFVASYTVHDDLAEDRITAILEDRDGTMWFGTLGGVSHFDGEKWISHTVEDGLGSKFVGALVQDEAGDLWVGTGYDRHGGLFAGSGVSQHVGGEFLSIPTEGGVMGLAEDDSGRLWLGTWYGTKYYDGREVRDFAPVSAYTWRLEQDRSGQMWFVTKEGIFVHDGRETVHYTIEDGVDNLPTNLYIDQNDSAWFAGRGGVVRFNGDRFVNITGKDSLSYRDIAEDRQGHIWLATSRGASRYDGERFFNYTVEDGLPSGGIADIHLDRRGDLWFCSFGGGVSHYDGKRFVNYTTEDGLSHNRIEHIMEDSRGHLWFSTFGGGVTRYDGLVFQSLLKHDGLIHDATHQVVEARDGSYWIAPEVGITRYRPQHTQPGIHLVNILADRDYAPDEEISLATTQDYIAFAFQGNSFKTRPRQMAYVYRLQGREADWQVTRERQVEYRDLPAGEYEFQVKAVDRDLNYSEAARVRVSMHLPYASIALWGGLGLALIGMATATAYSVRRRRELDQAQRELVQERRRRIEVQVREIEAWNLEDFVEQSPAMRDVFARMRRLQEDAESRALIAGEAGTGKELVARAIHGGSARRHAAFVPVRCAALPSEMASLAQRTEVLSQLFGHVQGAFDGADSDRDGLIQEAKGGTLFFDEVGHIPLPLQSHLLRVLTQGEVRRVGEQEGHAIDVRVLASTSMDLAAQVEEGSFNRELYEYLALYQVEVPPLRERPEDIKLLAQQFAQQVAQEMGQESAPLNEEVVAHLQVHNFPGNTRELHNIVAHALAESGGHAIEIAHLHFLANR